MSVISSHTLLLVKSCRCSWHIWRKVNIFWWSHCWPSYFKTLFSKKAEKSPQMTPLIVAKTCLPKSSKKSLYMNYEYLNVSVAQKLTELQFFSFFNCANIPAGFYLLRSIMCHSWGTLVYFNTYLRSCQLLLINFQLLNCWIRLEL